MLPKTKYFRERAESKQSCKNIHDTGKKMKPKHDSGKGKENE